MSCEMPRDHLVGYLYGEISEKEREGVSAHIAGCAACRQELEQLQDTRNILRAWPDEAPGTDLVFVRERTGLWKRLVPAWLRPGGWGRFAGGMAAGVAVAALLISFTGFEARYREGALHLRIGPGSQAVPDPPPPGGLVSAPASLRDVADLQHESLLLIQDMVRASETRQREALEAGLSQLAQGIERQRQRDLQLVGRGLEGVDRFSEYRFRHTDEMLQELVKLTSMGVSGSARRGSAGGRE